MAQVAQLEVVAQLPQELPPRGVLIPLSLVVKLAKMDNTRSASMSHRGQLADSLDWLTGRNFSNFESQSWQTYS